MDVPRTEAGLLVFAGQLCGTREHRDRPARWGTEGRTASVYLSETLASTGLFRQVTNLRSA